MSKVATQIINHCYDCPFEYGGVMQFARCGHKDSPTGNRIDLLTQYLISEDQDLLTPGSGIPEWCPLPESEKENKDASGNVQGLSQNDKLHRI